MIIQLIMNAIQALRGNPDGAEKPQGKMVALFFIAAAVALIVLFAMVPDLRELFLWTRRLFRAI